MKVMCVKKTLEIFISVIFTSTDHMQTWHVFFVRTDHTRPYKGQPHQIYNSSLRIIQTVKLRTIVGHDHMSLLCKFRTIRPRR
jgi:hypothetical protein